MPRYKNDDFLKAIEGSAGIIATVASKVGCTWHTARDRIFASPTLRAAYEAEQERTNDMAEATVLKSIRDGNTQDAKWWLARVRRDKFSERQEITGADGNELHVILRWQEDDANADD